jgi:peptide/nickel transport system substrate-binding protein
MSSKRGYARFIVYPVVALALMVMAVPTGTFAAPAQQGGSRLFPETNQTVAGRFLEVWSQNGDYATNLYINGFPLTDKHPEINFDDGKVYQTQWFERARFEEHPENTKPYDVLLGRLGAYVAEGRTDAPFKKLAAKPADCGANCDYFKESQHTISGDIRAYFYKYGGVSQFGFPLSETFTEASKDDASKSYTVQYFERQRFELHPENKGTLYAVLLGRLGAEQKDQSAKPQAAVTRSNKPVDVIKLGRGQDPSTLMPNNDSTLVGSYFLGMIFNGMVGIDGKNNLFGDLALFVPTLDNGGAFFTGTGADKRLSVKFKMKQGVKWQDGAALDSNDVIFTYKLNLDPDFPAVTRQFAQQLKSVDNPDAYTVIFNFLTYAEAADLIKRDASTYGFMQGFVDQKLPVTSPTYVTDLSFSILPAHFLSKMKVADIATSDYATTPWGTGPYYATKFASGQEIDLQANPNYNVTVDKPMIKQIVSPLFSDNKQLPVGMDTGNIDVTTAESITPDQAPDLAAVAAKGKVKYVNVPSLGYEHFDFVTTKAPFNDVRVRQAVAYALDRDAINKSIFAGAITFINTLIPPLSWASCENPANAAKADCAGMIKYSYNPDKAKSLLDAAGWTVGPDGIRVKGGKKLAIKWNTTTKSYRKAIATAQQQYLKAIGIDSTPNPIPAGQLFAAPPDGPLYSGSYGDFGLAEFAWADTGIDLPFSNLYSRNQIPTDANGFSGQNDTFWSNDQYEAAYADAQTQVGHTAKALTDYLKMQVIENNEVPAIGFMALPTQYLVRADLQNFQPGSFAEIWNIQQWDLP